MFKLTSRADRAERVARLRKRWPLTNPQTRRGNGLKLLQAVAALYQGQFNGSSYQGSEKSHSFTCRVGHQFTMAARHVLGGSWCPDCGVEDRRTGIDAVREFAQKRGGQCVSAIHKSVRSRLRWRCAHGHVWGAALKTVRDNNEWCPTCRAQERNAFGVRVFARLAEIARDRGGEVISPEYVDTRTKLRFRCAAGHEWDALPDSVLKKGTWCRQCTMNWLSPREQLAALRLVVRRQGGTLLSRVYVNRTTKVAVRCEAGHVWDVQPAKLHQGRWCPTCHYDRLRTYTTQGQKRGAKRSRVAPIEL
jgi:hypothetical protein